MENADPHRPLGSPAQPEFSAARARTLHQARCRHLLTPAELAARTGGAVSEAALTAYETGWQAPDVDVLWVLARALGEPVGALVEDACSRLHPPPGPDEPLP